MMMPKRYTRSSSFIVATTSAIILAIALSILAYFLYLFSNTDFVRETRAAIVTDIENMQDWYELHGIKEVIRILEHRNGSTQNHFYLLVDDKGQKLAGNLKEFPRNTTQEHELLKFEIPHTELVLAEASTRPESVEYDILAKTHRFDNGYQLLVGRDVDDVEITQKLVGILAWICLAVLILVMVANFLISLYVVRRVNHIAITAGQIMETGDLSQRILMNAYWDDLSYLARVLNHMLASIEKLVEGVKQVSDNIAHDLRSPLTRLQHRIEKISTDKPMTDLERQKLLQESQSLLAMFNGLLRIAEVESGKHSSEIQKVELSAIIQDAVELFEPVAQEKNLIIKTELTLLTHPVDRDLLFQAIINLLENSLKFTPRGGEVTITLSSRSGRAAIIVSDTGPGISDADKLKVFRRFYRVDTSRNTPGYGLGLSLVKAIVEYHAGTLTLEDNTPQGLKVTILL
ncbi:MAG: ATP-binding protein [Alphaproteobacteria bacterium]